MPRVRNPLVLVLVLVLVLAHSHADPRDTLTDQLAAQSETIDRSLSTVTDKLAAVDALRARRLRAAYRIIHAPPPDNPDERMLAARRLAAARLLVERDAAERELLAHEAERLRDAHTVTIAATTKLPTVTLPEQLLRPARGKIARHYGTFEHEKSRAMLSRRGIDIETEDHAQAVAPADGVIRYAGPIRGLDHGVILDHGGYLTIVAKLAELSLPVGAHVARGDRIGRAARHRVYLEVRVEVGPGGLPIDPEPLMR